MDIQSGRKEGTCVMAGVSGQVLAYFRYVSEEQGLKSDPNLWHTESEGHQLQPRSGSRVSGSRVRAGVGASRLALVVQLAQS